MEKVIYLGFPQGNRINGPLLAQNVSGVMVRAGQGTWKDPLFDYNYHICLDNEIPFGIWWFCQPNMKAEPQVEAFMSVWSSTPVKPLVIAYDVEEIDYKDVNGKMQKLFPPSRQFNHDNVLKWCKDVKRATNGDIGIYTRKLYFQVWTFDTPEWYQFWMWIAAWYRYTGAVKPSLPWKWVNYKIHQFEGGGLGTPGVDPAQTCKEYFNGTNEELREFFKNGGDIIVPPTNSALYAVQVLAWFLSVSTGPGVEYPDANRWLKQGDEVDILEESNGWGRYKDGWIRLKYTQRVELPEPPLEELTIPQEITAIKLRLDKLEAKPVTQVFGVDIEPAYEPIARQLREEWEENNTEII